MKATSDSLGQRKLKIVSANNTKVQKMFDVLKASNCDVHQQRNRYLQRCGEKL